MTSVQAEGQLLIWIRLLSILSRWRGLQLWSGLWVSSSRVYYYNKLMVIASPRSYCMPSSCKTLGRCLQIQILAWEEHPVHCWSFSEAWLCKFIEHWLTRVRRIHEWLCVWIAGFELAQSVRRTRHHHSYGWQSPIEFDLRCMIWRNYPEYLGLQTDYTPARANVEIHHDDTLQVSVQNFLRLSQQLWHEVFEQLLALKIDD